MKVIPWFLRCIFFFILYVLLTDNAYAYVDPGVAGTLYQIVILIFLGIGAFFAAFKNAIFNFFRLKKNKKIDKNVKN